MGLWDCHPTPAAAVFTISSSAWCVGEQPPLVSVLRSNPRRLVNDQVRFASSSILPDGCHNGLGVCRLTFAAAH